MKSLLFILVFTALISANLPAQDKPTSKISPDIIQSLIDQNEVKIKQVESLESLYKRISSEVIVTDALIDKMLNPISTRARCTAECDDGNDVTCSGDVCSAVDGAGCASIDEGAETEDDIEVTLCDDVEED